MFWKWIENEDKAFLRILSLVLFIYICGSTYTYINRSHYNIFLEKKRRINRFTRLIIDLPVPPLIERKKPRQKKEVKSSILPEKKEAKTKVIKEKKESKVIKEKKKQEEKRIDIKPKLTVRKKDIVDKDVLNKIDKSRKGDITIIEKKVVPESNLEDVGILGLIGAVDESIGGNEVFEIDPVAALTDDLNDNQDIVKDDINMIEEIVKFDDNQDIDHLNIIDLEEEREFLAQADKTIFTPEINIKKDNQVSKNLYMPEEIVEVKNPDSDNEKIYRSSQDIEKVVSGYVDGLRFCYDNSLTKKMYLAGDLLIKFTILPSGETQEVTTKSKDIKDDTLSSCIKEFVRRWKFPASDSDKVVITYPIVLNSKI